MRGIVIGIITIAAATAANAADGDRSGVVYLGAGPAKSDSSITTDNNGPTPVTLGFLHTSKTSDAVWGLDIAREGIMLDSTWGRTNAVKSSTSFNLLVGRNLGRPGVNSRLDAALILGARQKTRSCPASYLGYQCYADSEPDTDYGLNYGAVLTWSYSRVVFGVRATGESTQALFGGSF
jgi:hypothetical protein